MAQKPVQPAPRSQQLAELREQLTRESAALDDLEEALQGEHTALADRNASQLDRFVEQKQHAMEALNQAIAQRLDWMHQQGLESGPNGMAPLLQSPDSDDLAHMWHAIGERLTECQRLNEVNGQVLDVTREGVEQLLSIFQSSSGREQETVELYTAHGTTRSNRGDTGNSLTKA